MIALLLVQNAFLTALVLLFGYRIVMGRWPRRSPLAVSPGAPLTPLPPVPTVEESYTAVLDRLAANPPTPDYAAWPKERKEKLAREIAARGRVAMTK